MRAVRRSLRGYIESLLEVHAGESGDRMIRCAYCGVRLRRAKNRTKDHVVPKSRGGALSGANVVHACKSCNFAKGPHTPKEFLGALREAAGYRVAFYKDCDIKWGDEFRQSVLPRVRRLLAKQEAHFVTNMGAPTRGFNAGMVYGASTPAGLSLREQEFAGVQALCGRAPSGELYEGAPEAPQSPREA